MTLRENGGTVNRGPRRTSINRYVALGDSSTEGLDDPDGEGGYRGWATRLAERIATSQPDLLYANLAVRGYTTRQILETQLQPALDMCPDLVTLFSGTNDVVNRWSDALRLAEDIETMQRALIGQGATLLTFTLPDLTTLMPAARWLAPRVEHLNQILREVSSRTGAVLVDLASYPVSRDPRLWSEDRFHANALGHERIAAAFADVLGLPGADDSWSTPLPVSPPLTFSARAASELRWCRSHLLPWAWRRFTRRSLGDGRAAKRPVLQPL
ncbi:MAG TPA: SGNH/GDSL hydrolase family protein [Gemmatimonadales bacterium]|nr:SGNH/GDSL hydrolase family protein [Gemmatimonadales bacterium]